MVSGAFCAICMRLTLRAEATKSRKDGLRSVANLLQSIKATDLVSRDSQLSNFFSPIVMSWQSNMFWPWVLRFSHIQSLETKFITDGFFTALLSILPKAHFDWASKIYHQSNHNSHIRGRKISRKEKLKNIEKPAICLKRGKNASDQANLIGWGRARVSWTNNMAKYSKPKISCVTFDTELKFNKTSLTL